MANPSRLTYGLAAAVSNGIALAQTPSGAGSLMLNGSLVVAGPTQFQNNVFTNYAQLDVQRRVLVSSTGADSAVVFTISGFNLAGQPITETVTGVTSGTPVYTLRDFLQVTSVLTSGATAGAITVGTNGVGSTVWVGVNPYTDTWNLTAAVNILSGAVTYSVEYTLDDVNASISPPAYGFIVEHNSASLPFPWTHATLDALSASAVGTYVGLVIMAHRLTITAGTGQAAFYSVQSGIIS